MSGNPRPKIKLNKVKRATADTPFYIDFDWWDESNLDMRTYLMTRLELGEDVSLDAEFDKVDLIDPRTGEVHQVDGFQYIVQAYFHQVPDDFLTNASLVDAVFCILLANANQPMTAAEIAKGIGRQPDVVVRTLGGPKIYQGIRPVFED
ncbi:MAG: hypothetical protein ACK2UR_08980 [Candidatus Promineifilaceae bacterium]